MDIEGISNLNFSSLNFGQDIYYVFYTPDQRKGHAKILVLEGIDSETYIGEFTNSLINNGYCSIIKFEHPEKGPRLFSFVFLKDLIAPGVQNA